MKDFLFYNKGDNSDANDSAHATIIYADRVAVGFLMNQIAYDIIKGCEEYHRTGKFNLHLNSYTSMAEHGYINHFIKMVQFLFAFVEDNKNNRWTKSLVVDVKMIALALSRFKEIKDGEREKEIKEFGKHYGSATAYVNWNPCEFNKEWLADEEDQKEQEQEEGSC